MKLGNLVEISNGFAFESSKYVTRGIRVIRITNVQKGRIEDNDPKYYDPGTLSQLGRYSIEAGDILMSLTGNVGRVGLFPEELTPAYLNQRVARIRVSKNELDKKYLYYVLNSDKFENDAIHNSAGVAQLNLSTKWLSEYEIPLPPLEEQKKIAAILDTADDYRQKTKALIEKYDQLTQSLFKDMFGEMVYHTIGELIERKVITLHKDGNYGGMYPRKNEFGENGIPFLSAKHINDNGGFNFQNVPLLNHEQANKLSFGWIEKGDVLLSHNASVGKVVLYNGEFKKALIGTSLTCFRTEKALMNPYFLAFAFRSLNFQSQLRQNMGQTTRNQVPITAQKKLTLPTPVIHLQNQFAKRVELIEKQKQQAEASLVKADELFNSLLQRAFKGELTN